jgi:hypothetical protein
MNTDKRQKGKEGKEPRSGFQVSIAWFFLSSLSVFIRVIRGYSSFVVVPVPSVLSVFRIVHAPRVTQAWQGRNPSRQGFVVCSGNSCKRGNLADCFRPRLISAAGDQKAHNSLDNKRMRKILEKLG